MRYRVQGPSAIEQFTSTSIENSAIIDEFLSDRIKRIERTIDFEVQIASHFIWMFDTAFAPRNDAERTAFWLFEKTLLGSFDALSLLRRGAFGSARVVLRQVLEALIIGKFCAVSEDESLALKWQSGKQIYLGKEVLRRIVSPTSEPIDELWGLLSDYTHASRASQQGALSIIEDTEWNELTLTFIYLEIMLECNYHLLNSWVIKSGMIYLASTRKVYIVPELRREARMLFGQARVNYGSGAIKLLTTYKRKWVLKPVDPASVVRTPHTIRKRPPSFTLSRNLEDPRG